MPVISLAARAFLATSILCTPSPGAQEPSRLSEAQPDGSLVEREVVPGEDGGWVNHGRYVRRHSNGTELESGQFENGLRKGKWRYRFDSGEVRCTGSYRLGLRSGTWSLFYPGGEQLKAKGRFVKDRRHSDWEFFHPNGQSLAKGKYAGDHMQGPWTFSNGSGFLDARHTGEYRFETESYPGAGPRHAGHTLDGTLHGAWTTWWPDGTKCLDAWFERNQRGGVWRFWHVDGSFDPDMLSGEQGGDAGLLGFLQSACHFPPTEDDETRRELVLQASDRFDLASIPPIEETSQDPSPTEIDRFLSSEASRQKQLAADILQRGRDSLPQILTALSALDPSSEEGCRNGAVLHEALLSRLFLGHTFEWRPSTTPEDALHNRRTVLRWFSLYLLTRDQEEFWSIDMALPPRTKSTRSKSLLQCPTPLELTDRVSGSGLYDSRFGARRNLRAAGGSGTEVALAAGLKWLAMHQDPDGGWSGLGFMRHDPKDDRSTRPGDGFHDAGLTGLALLAFLGDGHTTQGGAYSDVVRAGVRWLIRNQDLNTGIVYAPKHYVKEGGQEGRMVAATFRYDHAIATQALCEALRYSNSQLVEEAARRAVAYAISARNPFAGWWYETLDKAENDSSITGWMIMALKSAQEAGLEVERSAFVGARNWFDEVTDPANGRVGYNAIGSVSSRLSGINDHYPPEKGEAMTAVGLLCRFFMGQDPEHTPIMTKHADLLLKTLPEWDPDGLGTDMYYWYHGSYAMYQMGGRHWKAWNKAMKPAVLESQRHDGSHDGSWDPVGPWGHAGGRIYSTALMVLCLEVYSRYARVLGAR